MTLRFRRLSGGVAILYRIKFDFKVQKVVADQNGHYVVMGAIFNNRRVLLVNVYVPGQGDNSKFISILEKNTGRYQCK